MYTCRLIIAIFFLSAAFGVSAQSTDTLAAEMPVLGPYDTIPVPAELVGGKWVPAGDLQWHWITKKFPKHIRKQKAEWTRLRNAVYVTYPYARKAGVIMNSINGQLVALPDKAARKNLIRSREKELRKEFTDPLQELSVYQGRVLMKLINRQTGNNCYEIIKEYKGSVNARVWQTVAFVFGSNLKQAYNPNEQDREIELIVQEVERMYGYSRADSW